MKLTFFRLCTVLFLVFSLGLSCFANRTGDVDGNGKVNAADARLTLRAAVKLETLQPKAFAAADVNADDAVSANDARSILRESVHLERFSGGLTVSFLDVGQADSILIECLDESMLIDGGNTADGGTVCAYLSSRGITELDYVVNSHADEDHVGGLASVLQNFPVSGQVLISPLQAETVCYRAFLSSCETRQSIPQTAPVGSTFSLGEASVTVLGPDPANTTNRNESSIVLLLQYGDTAFLFTGDAGTESEKQMLQNGYAVGATVLKVGHHGSRSSSGSDFLAAVGAEFGVISCGSDNTYGHPHEETLRRLSNAGITLFRTDLQGTITVISNGKTCAFYSDTEGTVQEPIEAECIGNISSKVFHRPTCSSLPLPKNQILFRSRSEAIEAGYTPCGKCKP